jgi:uncharacterized membrane protein YoaK (UPF0700 family)
MNAPSPAAPVSRPDLLLCASLGFIAGFADASTFVGADGVFCAHVTGNFVVLAADLARGVRADEWLKLATFPIFVASVLAASWLHRRLGPGAPITPSVPSPVSSPLPPAVSRSHGHRPTRALLTAESTLFGVAATVGVALPTAASASGAPRSAIVALLVSAMGIQNAIHRLSPQLGPMTTVMTGNVTQWFVERRGPHAPTPRPEDEVAKRRLLGAVIAAFAVGCVSGGLGAARLGFAVLVVPMAAALFARTRLR